MSEAAERPDGTPCFPWVAAIFCAACVGAAGWTWMRCSYAWAVSPAELARAGERLWSRQWIGRYVQVRVALSGRYDSYRGWKADLGVADVSTGGNLVVKLAPGERPVLGEPQFRHGRYDSIVRGPTVGGFAPPHIDTSASRFTGESVAGLIVGAMGVFVFTLAFRHWLTHRKTLGPQAAC